MEKLKELIIKYREILLYLIVGGLTTLVSLAVYLICTLTFLDPEVPVQLQAANVLSWIVSVTFAYVTNRRWVFQSRSPHILREAALFYLARLGTLGLDMLVMFLGVSVLGLNDRIVKLVSTVLVIAGNYALSKWIVFRKEKKAPEDPGESA